MKIIPPISRSGLPMSAWLDSGIGRTAKPDSALKSILTIGIEKPLFKRSGLACLLYGLAMVSYSDSQKRIALLLAEQAKSPESLAKELKLPLDEVMVDLKELLALKVVEKTDGFPTKYQLIQSISEEVDRRKKIAEDDPNKLKIRAIIEMQAVEPALLNKQTDKLMEAIQQEQGFVVYGISKASTLKQEEMYSTFLDLTFSVRNFKDLIKFMYFYGPITVEILRPAMVSVSAHELQEGLMDMAEMIQKYSQYISKLLNRQELEEFNKRLMH